MRLICLIWFWGHCWGPEISIWESYGYYDVGRKMTKRTGYKRECIRCGTTKKSVAPTEEHLKWL